MNRRVFILAALALGGCAGAVRVIAPPGGPLAELEPLYGAQAGRDALTVTVASSGCTAKADFAVYVEKKGEAVTLALGRRRLDTCRSFAAGRADLRFTWEELGLPPRTPVFLLNPLVAWRGPGA
ncbi:hypothetical protein [Phenylobacterium kunshanense]|uniref:Lipoprotein n=1 Tax=Phenylobacterium kunshanense TaxID=1445034 RepID=A0A328B8K5_9CAUL|nr:hypothetical protein [Phenylobacterium kunshanense]RAK63760.1 hypothetical protein DJ019_16055 [Phenylobacterium kunshanense]